MIDWRYMFNDTRARVYLLWAFLATSGFIITHYHQQKQINGLWFLVILLGLGYMLKVMPMRVSKLRRIFLSWLIPLVFGLTISVLAFYIGDLAGLIGYLGAFWLLIMAIGYFINGLVDAPGAWYFAAAAANAFAALAVMNFDQLLSVQYLLAAVVTAWSMLNLWLFRVE